jgi:hypothetical protein
VPPLFFHSHHFEGFHMNITGISVRNFMAIEFADLTITAPIAIFAGKNEVGKSSMSEAVRLALIGETVRVRMKKDYPQMVMEGAATGHIVVDFGNDQHATMQLPKGTATGTLDHAYALPFCLDPPRFALLPENDRRAFLFQLTQLKIDGLAVKQRLLNRGLDVHRVTLVMPMLGGGFPAASEYAAKKATEAKGAWRAITGETYGGTKAEVWRAAASEAPHGALQIERERLATAEHNLEVATREYTVLETKNKARIDAITKAKELEATAARADEFALALSNAEANVAEFRPEVQRLQEAAGDVPRKGLVHRMAEFLDESDFTNKILAKRAQTLLDDYVAEYGPLVKQSDPEAQKALPQALRRLKTFEDAVAMAKQHHSAAVAAAGALKALDTPPPIEASVLQAAAAKKAEAMAAKSTIAETVAALEAAVRSAGAALKKTEQAHEHHDDVKQWDAIAKALAPDGIPGEMLSAALTPINERLADSAKMTGWKTVQIGADMSITMDGRLYSLQSESSRWRADAMIAEAISHLSEMRIIALDRFDVLDNEGRTRLLNWLDALAEDIQLDTALIFGTMKTLPELPETFQRFWISEGHVHAYEQAPI